MTILVNDRDVLIQGTVPRFTPPTDRALLVDSDSQVFKVSAAGAGSPLSITLTAKLLNMVGTVTWAATGGSTLVVTGNTAVLNFASMVGGQTTITASIILDGQTYTSAQVITKVSDGTGSNGADGNSARRAYTKTTLGSLSNSPTTLTTADNTSYPPLDSWGTGTVWGGSPPVIAAGEQLYQSDGIFNAVTNITTWNVPYLSSLKVGQLSAITADLGSITAGDVYGATLHGGDGYPTNAYVFPTNGGTGFHLSAQGLLLGNSHLGKYVEIDSDGNLFTPQFSSVNGVATFGGSLSAVTGTIGLIQTRSDGARMQVQGDVIKVFDTSNVVRVKIGNLSL